MTVIEIPEPNAATRAAVAHVVELTIRREYGNDVAADLRKARRAAISQLSDQFRAVGADEPSVWGLADTTLRIMVGEGLTARTCQCHTLHPRGCPHGAARAGERQCTYHYEADVPKLQGALLCGTCHVVEWERTQA